ncbi:MAG: Slp family lipoprotein [Granulosicoccus sp.]
MASLFTVLFLASCASGPIKPEVELADLSVKELRAGIVERQVTELPSSNVLWGGLILNTQNLEDGSQIEVMAYPLDRRQRPMLAREPHGRFLVRYDSFLEPLDYAEGRAISLSGEIAGITDGTVGEATYQYPTVVATDLHLWREDELHNKPRLLFGIGVNLEL